MDILQNLGFSFFDLKDADDNLDNFEFDYYKNEKIDMGTKQSIYDTIIFNNNWSLLCDFDDRAIEDESKSMYVIYLNEKTTIKDLLLILKNSPTYGYFEDIEKIGNNKYKLIRGT